MTTAYEQNYQRDFKKPYSTQVEEPFNNPMTSVLLQREEFFKSLLNNNTNKKGEQHAKNI